MVKHSLLALARAHALMPGFDMSRAVGVAERIDQAVHDDTQMHVTVALVILLLKAIGVGDAADRSRLMGG